MHTRITTIIFIAMFTAISGCSNGLQTRVRTVSDAIPSTHASYALVFSTEQAADIESQRLARSVRANLVKLGMVEKDTESATYHVRFALAEDSKSQDNKGSSVGMHYPVSHATTSQASVAGVGIPGTQRKTVHHDTTMSYSNTDSRRDRHNYRLEISFLANEGAGSELRPIHKMIVESKTTRSSLQSVAPCLVDAAFRDFPNHDGAQHRVEIADCRS